MVNLYRYRPELNIDFGAYLSGIGGDDLGGSITGIKYLDLNSNRLKDDNEDVLKNSTVYLDINKNGVMDGDSESGEPRVLTNDQGIYRFDGLAGDVYHIRSSNSPFEHQTTPVTNHFNAVDISVDDGPRAVQLADMNKDGFEDIVVANAVTNNVTVVLLDESGNVLEKSSYQTGYGPSGIQLSQ